MRFKSSAALLAASSLMLASTSAVAAAPLSIESSVRASAATADESELLDSGMLGVALVFGLGLIAGYLLATVLDGDEDPVSP